MTDPTPQPFEPSAAQIQATISVLGDDSSVLQQSARRQLLAWGKRSVPLLKRGAEADHMSTRMRCRSLLRAIEVRDLGTRISRLRLGQISRHSALELLEGAVLGAQMVNTFVPDSRKLAAQLLREANSLRHECVGRSTQGCAKLLVERLHGQFGLRGCDAEEVGVDHLLIDRVMQSKVGAPVMLSLIYLVVARWAGMSAVGVAIPNHFLIRIHGPRPILLDPFHGGRVILKSDCARYLRATGVERVRDHLRDLSDREFLIHAFRALWGELPSCHSGARTMLGEALGQLEAS